MGWDLEVCTCIVLPEVLQGLGSRCGDLGMSSRVFCRQKPATHPAILQRHKIRFHCPLEKRSTARDLESYAESCRFSLARHFSQDMTPNHGTTTFITAASIASGHARFITQQSSAHAPSSASRQVTNYHKGRQGSAAQSADPAQQHCCFHHSTVTPRSRQSLDMDCGKTIAVAVSSPRFGRGV